MKGCSNGGAQEAWTPKRTLFGTWRRTGDRGRSDEPFSTADSMAEMAHARQDHRKPMFIRRLDDFSVANGAAGLNDSGYPCLSRGIKAVTEWEKRVGRHHAALHRHEGLHRGQLHAIHPAHLPSTDAHRLPWLRIDDGIRLDVFTHCPRKRASGIFFIRRFADGRHRQRT